MNFDNSIVKQLGVSKIEKFHTPFMQLDFSLGKGFGEGVWIETFAPEGLGKTTLFLQTVSKYLLMNDNAYLLFLDVEKSLDNSLLETVFFQENVYVDYETNKIFIDDVERGTILMPDTYDEIETVSDEFFKWCMNNKKKGIVVWDSLVSAVTKEVQQKGSDRVGYKATHIQAYIERFLKVFRKIPVTLLVVNQIREKIQIMMGQDKSIGGMIDGDYNVPGGKAHKFYSFQSLMLVTGRKWQYGSTNDKIKGKIVKIIPTKNKQAPDKRQVDLIKIDDYGFSNLVSLLEFLKNQKIISGTCAGFTFPNIFDKFGFKKLNLEKIIELCLTNNEFFDLFFDVCFNALDIYYRESKRINRYNKNEMKEILLLDIKKLDSFLKFINEHELKKKEFLSTLSSKNSEIESNVDNIIESKINEFVDNAKNTVNSKVNKKKKR